MQRHSALLLCSTQLLKEMAHIVHFSGHFLQNP